MNEPIDSIDFQQQRGMLADAVDWAINEYDSYMVNDDYDAQAVLDQIVSRLKEIRTITSLRTSETTGGLDE